MKKLVSFVMAAVLCAGFASMAFAEEIDQTRRTTTTPEESAAVQAAGQDVNARYEAAREAALKNQ